MSHDTRMICLVDTKCWAVRLALARFDADMSDELEDVLLLLLCLRCEETGCSALLFVYTVFLL